MALSLDTIITVANLVRGTVDLYNRIHDWPEQMKRLGRRMKNLNVYLSELEEIVTARPNSAFSRLFSTQKKHLGVLLQDIRKDTESIQELFHKWENDIGPLGFQFRFKTVTAAFFALGSSSDRVAELTEDINEHLQGIRDYLILMGFKATVLIGEQQQQNPTVPQAPVLGKPVKPSPASGKNNEKDKRKPSPSPSPAPPRKDFKIIFVDPGNIGRGVVGEALAKLMKEWTKSAKGDWRIQTIHSGGLLVKDKTDLPADIPSLKRDIAGSKPPVGLALDAVFDNKAFDFPAKKDVHIAMLKKRSNGLKRDIFKKYDFILVFTSLDHERMLKVKSALVEKEGVGAVTAKGKGRVLHLGSYLTLDGIPREIDDPRKTAKEPKVTRAEWNWKTAQIKLAVKEFLKQEMQWKPPPPRVLGEKLDAEEALKKKKLESQTDKQKGEVGNAEGNKAAGKPGVVVDQRKVEQKKKGVMSQQSSDDAEKGDPVAEVEWKKKPEIEVDEAKDDHEKNAVQVEVDEKPPPGCNTKVLDEQGRKQVAGMHAEEWSDQI